MKAKILGMLALLLLMGQTAKAQQADYSKLSGLLITKLNEFEKMEDGLTPSSNPNGASPNLQSSIFNLQSKKDVLVMPLVKADSEETLTRHGVYVFDHIGDIYFTAMPMSRVAALSNDEGVKK